MSGKTKRVGEDVELQAQVQDAQPGDDVTFTVATADGAEQITKLRAPVEEGVARATWTVDLGGRAGPLDVVFHADCLGSKQTSSVLRVEGDPLDAHGGWILSDDPSSASITFDSEAESDVPPEGFGGANPTPWLGSDEIEPGTPLAFRVELGGSGEGEVKAEFALERDPDGSGSFSPELTLARTADEPASVALFHWTASGEGQVRVVAAWSRAGEEGPGAVSRVLTLLGPPPPPPPPPTTMNVALQLHDGLHRPAANTSYTLNLDGGPTLSGTTDGQGWLRHELPLGIHVGTASFSVDGHPLEIEIAFSDDEEGSHELYMLHLENMGFLGEDEVATILRFQAAAHLPLSGEFDLETRGWIERILLDDEGMHGHVGRSSG